MMRSAASVMVWFVSVGWLGKTSELLDIPRLESVFVVDAPHLVPLLICDIQIEAKAEDDARTVLAVVAFRPRVNAVAWRVTIEHFTLVTTTVHGSIRAAMALAELVNAHISGGTHCTGLSGSHSSWQPRSCGRSSQ